MMFANALNLTFFGMGFVFVFLSALVFSIKLMSYVALKIPDDTTGQQSKQSQPMLTEIDEDTRLIIEQAIKQHIKKLGG